MKKEINAMGQSQRMSSLEIAQLTGKQHAHVMEAIRKMEPAWLRVGQSNFRLASYLDAQGKARPCYSLTKSETLYIATKFNDEARARLVLRWEQLETQERQRWMEQHARAASPIVDLSHSLGAHVYLLMPGATPFPIRLLQWRPWHGPVHRLLARTAHGIVREGELDYTLYVRVSKQTCQLLDAEPQEMFAHEVRQLMEKLEA